MKIITLCFFLVLGLAACSENQQEKIDEINEKNAQKATDYIQKPIDKARDVQEMSEKRMKDFQKSQE